MTTRRARLRKALIVVAVCVICGTGAAAIVATQPPLPWSVEQAIRILGRPDLGFVEKDPARSYLDRRMDDPAVVSAVLSELRSSSTAARGEMFMLLQLTDNEYTTAALTSLLDNERWSGDAAYALAMRGNPAGRDDLERAIDEAHDPTRIRELRGALSIITSATGE